MTLHKAAEHGDNTRAIEALLHRGAHVNARQEGGWTPLHIAAAEGRTEICGLLLDRGADVNAEDEDGNTPLYLAAKDGHTETAALLREHGGVE
jgi:ankyrin repeat protein